MAEAALPGFESSAWHGVFAPAGTPQAVIARLSSDMNTLLKSAHVVQRFASQGVEVTGGSVASFASFIDRDILKYQKLVKTAGIRID